MRPDVIPLSFAQERIWFVEQLIPGSTAYNMTAAYRLRGHLDLTALDWSLNQIIRRHDVLRTTIVTQDGRPSQKVAAFTPSSLVIEDLSHEPDPNEPVLSRLQAERNCPFDLAAGPLFRYSLLALGPESHVLVLGIHHIIFDGESLAVFCQELSQLYASHVQGQPCVLPELSIQYADYSIRQRQRLQGRFLDEQLSYWRRQLADAPAVLEMPADHPRPSVPTFRSGSHCLHLSQHLFTQLRAVGKSGRATPFMVLLAIFQVLFYRLTGQEDVVVGAPIATRGSLDVEGMIGLFLNNLVIRTRLTGSLTFSDVLAQVRETTLGAYAHQELPFEKLVEELRPDRKLSHSPLFQAFLNVQMSADEVPRLPGIAAEKIAVVIGGDSKFDLTLYAHEQSGGIQLMLVYNSDLFVPERMEGLLEQFHSLTEQVAAAPHRSIDWYSLVTPQFQGFLPNPTVGIPEPMFEPITTLFDRWAQETPDLEAVCWKDRSWTYSELREASARIAERLKGRGLRRGDVVALTGFPSYDLVASMLGVLRAGGVMLTLDSNLPINRQKLMLEESPSKFVIRSGNLGSEHEWLRELPDRVATHIDEKGEQGITARDGSADIATDAQISGDDPAYVFFTSGTTGIPKAVLGCHKGLSHFLSWQRDTFQVTSLDRCAQLIGLSFDAVLRDIFLPLTSGATLCLPEANRDPESLMAWMQSQQVTLVHTVPAVAQNWIGQIRKEVAMPSLRWVFFSGEPLRDTLIREMRLVLPGKYQIVNLYGPTETTLVKCFFVVPDPPLPGIQPVGRPLPETQAWVTNSKDQLCGLGEIGEIVLRTPFRTLGYANSRLETARHFRKNPYREDDGDLVYFTGDLGRYRPDGSLDILGRRDHQVKIRGVRIELDEIAAVICKHPQVATSVVVFRKQVEPQDLVAYVVPKNLGVALRDELRAHLASHLPAAMIPAVFVFLESLPLTANGKIDRKALPMADSTEKTTNEGHVAPRSAIEVQLATIWSEVLGVSKIGAFDNFFDLGGQSLLATQVASRIQRDLRVECPLKLIFETPNLAALALILGHRLNVPSEQRRMCNAEADAQHPVTLTSETKQEI